MLRLRSIVLLALILLTAVTAILLPVSSADAQVRVRGYFRKDGTYVQPHYRSAPDGNPYNNWSFPGNVNPYTGEVAKGDPEAYLRNYYQRRAGVPEASTSDALAVEQSRPSAVLPHFVSQEELQRSRSYCNRIYSLGDPGRTPCEANQYRTLAGILLPDYSRLPREDVARSASYCERIYDDDRAGFYSCVNHQILGLRRGSANFARIESDEAQRAQSYCERVYGDDRAGASGCARHQAQGLASAGAMIDGLPPEEWRRADAYCERIYADDRAGAQGCKRHQAEGVRRHVNVTVSTAVPAVEWRAAVSYCERIYSDDRAGALGCRNHQALDLAARKELFTSSIDPNRHAYCERIYSSDRAGYWQCVVQR